MPNHMTEPNQTLKIAEAADLQPITPRFFGNEPMPYPQAFGLPGTAFALIVSKQRERLG